MPSNTFLNLPEDKQTRLMDAASREFSAKPYNEVSINKIIQDAGIPGAASICTSRTRRSCSTIWSTVM